MIDRIYKSRLFRISAYFFISVIFGGCFSEYMISKPDPTEISAYSLQKIYLKDGRYINFVNRDNPNFFVSVNENEFIYRNREGDTFMLTNQDIEKIFVYKFSFLQTFLFVLKVLVIVGIGFLISAIINAPPPTFSL